MSGKSRILILLGTLALVGIVVLYVLEFQWFQNYFNPVKLVIGSLAVGLALGLVLALRFQKKADELDEKMQLWAACLIVPLLFMPLLGSLTNRFFAKQAELEEVVFWEETSFSKLPYGLLKGEKPKPDGFYIFVVREGEMVRLESKASMYPGALQGDKVKLAVKRGLFGVDYADF